MDNSNKELTQTDVITLSVPLLNFQEVPPIYAVGPVLELLFGVPKGTKATDPLMMWTSQALYPQWQLNFRDMTMAAVKQAGVNIIGAARVMVDRLHVDTVIQTINSDPEQNLDHMTWGQAHELMIVQYVSNVAATQKLMDDMDDPDGEVITAMKSNNKRVVSKVLHPVMDQDIFTSRFMAAMKYPEGAIEKVQEIWDA